MECSKKKNNVSALELLGQKGICPGGYFVVRGERESYYHLNARKNIIGLDGTGAAFSEDDIWESYENVERCEKEEYEGAAARRRDEIWRERGQPTQSELVLLAKEFAAEYFDFHDREHWTRFCMDDEETLCRMILQAIALRFPEDKLGKAQRQKRYQKIFRDVVFTKISQFGQKK